MLWAHPTRIQILVLLLSISILLPLWMLIFSSVQEGDSPVSQGTMGVFWVLFYFWVFIAVCGLSLVVVKGGYPSYCGDISCCRAQALGT